MFKKIIMSALISVVASLSFTASASADMKGWQKAVVKAVAKKQRYPRSAISREIEGKAKIRLVVAADGAITAHEIVEATGEEILDREIPKLVNRLNPLPAVPSGKTLTFILPVSWTLD